MLRGHARKVGVFIAGWLIVIVGLLLIPLPGPGWAIVFVGLSLLATEFEWANRLKQRVQALLASWVARVQERRAARSAPRRTGPVDAVIDDVLDDVEAAASDGPDDHSIAS